MKHAVFRHMHAHAQWRDLVGQIFERWRHIRYGLYPLSPIKVTWLSAQSTKTVLANKSWNIYCFYTMVTIKTLLFKVLAKDLVKKDIHKLLETHNLGVQIVLNTSICKWQMKQGPNFIKHVSTQICLAWNFFLDKKQDYHPNFICSHIACYWHSAVVCLSWKSHENLVGNPTGFMKLGQGVQI